MASHEPVLSSIGVARRVQALFNAMATDYLLREQFVTDPARIYFEYVHQQAPDLERRTIDNQFLYSVMASADLLRWLASYVRAYPDDPPPHRRFLADFAQAVVETKAATVVTAMLRAAHDGQALHLLEVDFPFFLLESDSFDLPETAMTTQGTDIGPTTQGTEIGPTTQGTEIGPTTQGTEIGPTTQGTEIGPTTQGTEIGPTTQGTEIGPTDQGILNVTAIFGQSYWSVTLSVLAVYARRLRESGALDYV
jgi:hypothetical protein